MNDHTASSEIIVAAGQFIDERNYWLEKLAGDIQAVGFPRDIRNITSTGTDHAIASFEFDETISRNLERLSNGSDARAFMILAAEVFLLLGKYNMSDEIIIGSPIETQEIEGDFINRMLALKSAMQPGMTFKDLLLQVRQTVVEANKHQNYPLELLSADLGLGFNSGAEGLFDVIVLLENLHDRRYAEGSDSSFFFLFHFADGKLRCQIEYDPGMYSLESVCTIESHLASVMEQTLPAVDTPLEQVTILSGMETNRLIHELNGTAADFPQEKTLHRLVEESVLRYPDNVCLQYGDIQVTYSEFNRRSETMAKLLAANGVSRGSIVPLVAGVSIDTITGMMAIMKTGASFLPIDVEYPEERIGYMINDSAADLVLGAECFVSSYAWKGNLLSLSECFEGRPPERPSPQNACSGSPAYVIYTSGSTGKPKGVVVEHRSIVNQLDGLLKRYRFTPGLHHILMAPITFDPSVQQIFLPLASGAKLHLLPNSIKKDALKLWNYLSIHRIDILNTVPSLMEALISPEAMMASGENIGSIPLKYVILAGESFTRKLYLELSRQLNVQSIINIYGPTEATINTTAFDCRGDLTYSEVPIGKPLQNYKVAIVDHMLRLLPAGAPGEMCIGGEGLARGYLNNPELTEEKFVSLPMFGGERFYRTGDLARWNRDGLLEFAGRVDDQVKIRGQRVEPMEIDQRLLTIPGVSEAVTLAVADRDGNKQLCSYYVAESGDVNPDNIRERLSELLPGYMVPLYVMKLEKMPLTAHHKIDKKRLPEPDITASANYVPPRDPMEEALVQIWREVLGLEKIGVKDNYFSIGGDSIKAIKLLSVINSRLNINLGVIDLFANRTIETLSLRIQRLAPDDVDNELRDAADEVEDFKNKYLQGLQNNDG